MKNIRMKLCIATILALTVGCATTMDYGDGLELAGPIAKPWNLKFVATEFTRPHIEVSPNGREFYFDALGEIYRVPVRGGKAVQMALGAGWKTIPVMSDDGRWLAYESDADDTQRIRQFWGKVLSTGDAPQVLGAMWRSREGSPPITASAYVYPGVRQRWNVATGLAEHFAFELEGFKGQFRLSRDGKIAGYETLRNGESVLALYTPATATTATTGCRLEPMASEQFAPTFAFMPDGDSVILSRGAGFHRCWFNGRSVEVPVSADVDKSMTPMVMPISTSQQRTQIRYPVLDMARRRLFFTAKGKVWRSNLSGGTAVRLTAGNVEELMPTPSPDGTRIAYVVQDGRAVSVRVHDLATGSEQILLESEKAAYANPAWSPDGSHLVFVEVQNMEQRGRRSICCSIKYMDVAAGHVHTLGPGRMKPLSGSELYPRPIWSATGDALYYTREVFFEGTEFPEKIALIRHPLAGEPVVMLTTQLAINDAVVSPDGTRVALRDRLGISFHGTDRSGGDANASPRHVTLQQSRNLSRLWLDDPDYVAWTPDGRLSWSIQDEVFVGTHVGGAERVAQIKLPENAAASEEVKVYLGGRIVSMGVAGTIERGAIVTEGATIRYIGESSKLPSEFSALQAIDIQGKTIIPGLVDVHRHTWVDQDDFSTQRNHLLFADLAYGVTTLYDPSIHTVKSAYLTDVSRDDGFLGPTFYGSGQSLLDDEANGSYAYIGGLADARAYVDRAVKAAVPLVKAYMRRARKDRRLIVQAAREAGIGVASHESEVLHAQLSQVQDGFTAIEHTSPLRRSGSLYADVIEYLKRSRVMLTPTVADESSNQIGAAMWERTPRDERFACLVDAAKQRRSWEQVDAHGRPQQRGANGEIEISHTLMNLMRVYASLLNDGLPVSIGAHGLPGGVGTHWEMWALAEGGATPMNVLRAATVNGAYKLGMQHRIGSLAEGMDADFVILSSNPLDDIYNTADIAHVVRRGRVVQWPDGDNWPQSWPGESDWSSCKAWNLGASAIEASGVQSR